MSAEVENNKEEEVKEQKPRRNLKDLFKEYCLLGIKLLQLLICAICVGCSYDPLDHEHVGIKNLHHIGVMYTAYTGYMVINCIMIISRLIGDRIPFRTALLFAVTGAALFLVTGILLAYDRANSGRRFYNPPHAYLLTMLTTSIIFAFINGIVFLGEVLLIFKLREDY